MKHFSSILNIVLLAAVAILYVLHFKSSNSTCVTAEKAPACFPPKGQSVAYVDMDSLDNNVVFIKAKEDELQAEQKRIEANLESKYRQLEADKDDFIKKGTATQLEQQQFQDQYMQRGQQLEEYKQQQSGLFAEKSAKTMQDLQARVKSFLNDYNQEKKYSYIFETGAGVGNYILYKDSALNITNDIVNGLNNLKTSNN